MPKCPIHFLGGESKNSSARDYYNQIRTASPESVMELGNSTEINYALAGHVIEFLWGKFKLSEEFDSPIFGDNSEKWRNFNESCIEKIDGNRIDYLQESHKTLSQAQQPSTQDIVIQKFLINKLEENPKLKGIPCPSFIDMVVFFSSFAQAIEQMGFDSYEIMSHHLSQHLVIQMMYNPRHTLHPFIGTLEGNDYTPQEDDTYREFIPDNLEILQDSQGRNFLGIKNSIIEDYKKVIQDAIKNMENDGKTLPTTLTCPVLYSGIFSEVYNWLLQELHKINNPISEQS